MSETRITFRGRRFNVRTRDMLLEAERRAGRTWVITQGSYNPGGTAASGGTHDGGGVFDLRMEPLTSHQRAQAVLALRMVGFAAWLRTPAQSDWPYHIHAVAIGDDDLSDAARNQVAQYKAGRNGLANGGPDDGPGSYRKVTWESYQAAPNEEDDMTPQQQRQLAEAHDRATWAQNQIKERGSVDRRIDHLTDVVNGLVDDVRRLAAMIEAKQ